mmetsp:Transcript_5142/g.6644  ORF Transcript_5142/g.6644 Transcript_5142/m.6644 type:complete len:558 (+) Transcript_5142:141-1814(+)
MPSKRRNRSAISKSVTRNSSTKSIDFALDDNDDVDDRGTQNDIIASDDESSIDSNDRESDISSDEEDKETIDAKRVRLAREYLSKMEQADDDDSSSVATTSSEDIDSDDDEEGGEEDIEMDRISKKLKRERLKRQGTLERMISTKLKASIEEKWAKLQYNVNDDAISLAKIWVQNNTYKLCRGHDLTPTCVALHSPSGSRAYSASKDNSIIMWDVDTQCKLHTIEPKWNPNRCDYTRNSGEVLAMTASDDGRYLAVGGRDATVKIYDVRQKKAATTNVATTKGQADFQIRGIATTFEGHKGPVTALAFRAKSLQLFSGSSDRCIRHYNLNEMAYIETLYGHQAQISGLSCYGIRNEIPFSVGRDRTARAWKLEEETHLIFRGGAKLSSADCISAIKDDWFLSGHDDGTLNLWYMTKKKAVESIETSHGFHGNTDTGTPNGIVSCASLVCSDVAITGSNDGYMRLWSVSTGETLDDRGIDSIGKIPIQGYINDIAIGPKARFCVAAVGQEPRLGRWDRVPFAKNRFAIIPLIDYVDKDENADDETLPEVKTITHTAMD